MESMYLEHGGQAYKTVRIGTQTWMAENFNYEAEGSKLYENNPGNGPIYGRLYDWDTAMKACPEGWHLPTDIDWNVLCRFVDYNIGYETPYESATAGKRLKAADGWNDNGGGTDDYGFAALPGGFCYSFCDYSDFNFYHSDNFYDVGDIGRWWSSSSAGYYACYRYMFNGDGSVCWSSHYKNCYFLSVRYIQD